MAGNRVLRIRLFVAFALVFIGGLVVLGYAQYQSSVAAEREAALKTELFRARDAIDSRLADTRKR